MVLILTAKERLLKRVDKVVTESITLANQLRVLILAIIALRREVYWYEVKEALERLVGPVNPNTLAFHINKLIEVGYVKRARPQRSPRYVAEKIPDKVQELLDDLKEALGEGK